MDVLASNTSYQDVRVITRRPQPPFGLQVLYNTAILFMEPWALLHSLAVRRGMRTGGMCVPFERFVGDKVLLQALLCFGVRRRCLSWCATNVDALLGKLVIS